MGGLGGMGGMGGFGGGRWQPHGAGAGDGAWHDAFDQRAARGLADHGQHQGLVFGRDGDGAAARGDFVVEVLVRGGAKGADGRRRGVERVLEAWSDAAGGPCELHELDALKPLFAARKGPTGAGEVSIPLYILSVLCMALMCEWAVCACSRRARPTRPRTCPSTSI